MKLLNAFLLALVTLLVSACSNVNIAKVESGDVKNGRLQLTIDGSWNHISTRSTEVPNVQRWTRDGFPIDTLVVYAGLADNAPLNKPVGPKGQEFLFRADMQSDRIVALYESMLTADGSVFKLNRLEPVIFGNTKGFRFEYTLIRRVDNVELSGIASACVHNGELFAITYHAPKLGFYPRQEKQVIQIMDSAKIGS